MKHKSTSALASQRKKIALGMSGGVDSSLCAHLLVEQGYDVTGVYLECWRAPGCRTDADRADALKVALSLGIKFQVLDFKDAYKKKVVDSFLKDYKSGLTPNPDVMCNKEIKFGLFYDWAIKNGFDAVATGHYAKIIESNRRHDLAIPADQHKDQTYFLCQLQAQQLNHIIFPLANLTKQQVRAEATKRHLHVATKKDSVGICFIGDINVHNFLKDQLGENPGAVVDTKGNVIGKHQGLWFYTIGQRSGFDIDKTTLVKLSDGSVITKHNFPPFYVIGKNPETNQLIVGFGQEALRLEFNLANLQFIHPKDRQAIESNQHLTIRIRHTGELIPCQIKLVDKNSAHITLGKPVQGVAEGQVGVGYVKNLLVFSGIITCR